MRTREDVTQRQIAEGNKSDRKRDAKTATNIAKERRHNVLRDKRTIEIRSKHFTISETAGERRRRIQT